MHAARPRDGVENCCITSLSRNAGYG
jgi:hypothetical protein